MRTKVQVTTHKACAYYADLVLLSISVSWIMLLDKRSSFVLVVCAPFDY